MNIFQTGCYLSLRTVAFGVAFAITAWAFYLSGSGHAFAQASPWWPAYGLLANLLCLLFVHRALKKENISLLSLINIRHHKFKRDMLLSIAFIFVSIVLGVGAAFLFGYIMYQRYPYELIPSFSGIPWFMIIIFVIVFPIVNSFIEQITYNGFLFPRLEAQVKNTRTSIFIVLFFFTLQHVFITFAPDVKYMIWRLLSFVPLLLFWILVYAKMRRLTTLIVVHWFMDTFAIVSILFAPA